MNIKMFFSLLLIIFSFSKALAFSGMANEHVTAPDSACVVSYMQGEKTIKICSGVLLMSDAVLTANTCEGWETRGARVKVKCGNEDAVEVIKTTHDSTYVFNDRVDIDHQGDEMAVKNMSILKLKKSLKATPAKIELANHSFADHNFEKQDCIVAGAGAENPFKDTKVNSVKIHEFGRYFKPRKAGEDTGQVSRNILGSELIAQKGDLGGPLYCKNEKGEYVVRAIYQMNNAYTTFYGRLDANSEFISGVLHINGAVPAKPSSNGTSTSAR